MADFPVYHNMSERGEVINDKVVKTGGWSCIVQNSDGRVWDQDFRDPIMAESAAAGKAAEFGVELPLTVIWLNGRKETRKPTPSYIQRGSKPSLELFLNSMPPGPQGRGAYEIVPIAGDMYGVIHRN